MRQYCHFFPLFSNYFPLFFVFLCLFLFHLPFEAHLVLCLRLILPLELPPWHPLDLIQRRAEPAPLVLAPFEPAGAAHVALLADLEMAARALGADGEAPAGAAAGGDAINQLGLCAAQRLLIRTIK